MLFLTSTIAFKICRSGLNLSEQNRSVIVSIFLTTIDRLFEKVSVEVLVRKSSWTSEAPNSQFIDDRKIPKGKNRPRNSLLKFGWNERPKKASMALLCIEEELWQLHVVVKQGHIWQGPQKGSYARWDEASRGQDETRPKSHKSCPSIRDETQKSKSIVKVTETLPRESWQELVLNGFI